MQSINQSSAVTSSAPSTTAGDEQHVQVRLSAVGLGLTSSGLCFSRRASARAIGPLPSGPLTLPPQYLIIALCGKSLLLEPRSFPRQVLSAEVSAVLPASGGDRARAQPRVGNANFCLDNGTTVNSPNVLCYRIPVRIKFKLAEPTMHRRMRRGLKFNSMHNSAICFSFDWL